MGAEDLIISWKIYTPARTTTVSLISRVSYYGAEGLGRRPSVTSRNPFEAGSDISEEEEDEK